MSIKTILLNANVIGIVLKFLKGLRDGYCQSTGMTVDEVKAEVIEYLDELVKLKGLAEMVSDIAIKAVINKLNDALDAA